MEEIEVKFLDIDPSEIEKKLEKIGAKKVFDKLYRRKVYDYPDLSLHRRGAWVRLRDEGDAITLTYKQRLGMNTTAAGDSGMEEVEIEVSDFEETALLLQKMGLQEKFYEENKRTRYEYGSINFDIDTWPMLKPYLEIEAANWEEVDRAIQLLGLDPDKKKIFSTYQVYKQQGIDEMDFAILTFDKVVKRT